jgi:coenzyme Q-binding protein COQ10
LHSTWAFRAAEGGCEVDFSVDFEFRNPILAGLIGLVFNEAMQRIVRAFEARAAALYPNV